MPKLHTLRTAHCPAVKALIIYDNFEFAAKAKTILQRASDQMHATIHWNIRPWRVDALNVARNADEALTDAADTNLIVFAGPRSQSVPSRLMDAPIGPDIVAGALTSKLNGFRETQTS